MDNVSDSEVKPTHSSKSKAIKDASDELAKAKAELAALEATRELELTRQKIDSLKNGGKTPGQLRRIREAEEKRAKTFKFTDAKGQVWAKYLLTQRSYKDGLLKEKGETHDLPIDKLPGDTMLPVEKKAEERAADFKPV